MAGFQIPDHAAAHMVVDHQRRLRILAVWTVNTGRNLVLVRARNSQVFRPHTRFDGRGDGGERFLGDRLDGFRWQAGKRRRITAVPRHQLQLRLKRTAADGQRFAARHFHEQAARQFHDELGDGLLKAHGRSPVVLSGKA